MMHRQIPVMSTCVGRCVAVVVGLATALAASHGFAGTRSAGAMDLVAAGGVKAGATLGSVTDFGDIGTAQAFKFSDVVNIADTDTGYFDGLTAFDVYVPLVNFTFTSTGANTSVLLSDSSSGNFFGTFQSTYAKQNFNTNNGSQKSRQFEIFGFYTNGTISQTSFPSEPGTRGSTLPSPVWSSWTVTLNQQVGVNQSISFASNFAFPAAVPEPGTTTLALVGMGVLAAGRGLRRRWRGHAAGEVSPGL